MNYSNSIRSAENALTKAFATLDGTEPQEFNQGRLPVFDNIRELINIRAVLMDLKDAEGVLDPDEPAEEEPAEEEPTEEEPTEEEQPEEHQALEKEEKPAYKMEEVRGALAAARRNGVNLAELFHSFGVANFTQITEDQYPALMAKLAEVG